jgi:serine/threonine protein kinase
MGDDLTDVASQEQEKNGSPPVGDDEHSAFLRSRACLVGTMLGQRYRIDSLLGLGGWSAVYKGADLTLGRSVAVKILHSHLIVSSSVHRFRREAEVVSKLVHPNLTVIHDFGLTDDQQPYMVMELVVGNSVADLLDQGKQFAVEEAVNVVAQIADALQMVHDVGLVHRDIKPSNIMLTVGNDSHGCPKLLDFGLVKVVEGAAQRTATGETVGTPAYMSPEQCKGDKLDARSDVYSLGCVLYEMITGKMAFDGANAFECMHKHFVDLVEPMSKCRPDLRIDRAVEDVVACAMALEPGDRFASMRQFKEALQAVLSGDTRSSKHNLIKPARKRFRNSVWLAVGLVTATVVLGLCMAYVLPGFVNRQQPGAPSRTAPSPTARPPVMHSVTDVALRSTWQSLEDQPTIDLSGSDVTDAGLVYLGRLKRVKGINLNKTSVRDLTPLSGIIGLNNLELAHTQIDDKSIRPIFQLRLHTLNLDSTAIGDSTLQWIAASFKNLQGLQLSHTKVTDAAAQWIHSLHNLGLLIFDGTRVGDATMAKLPGDLTWLFISDTNVTDAGFRKLEHLHHLGHLFARNLNVTPSGLKVMKTWAKIEELDLSHNQITDETCAQILPPQIYSLTLNGTGVGDNLGPALSKCYSLSWLVISNTSITDAGLRKLAPLSGLNGIILSQCEAIDDQGIDALLRLPHLNLISLSYTKVSKAGLLKLKSLRDLQTLRVCGLKLSRDDIAELSAALPQCKIITHDIQEPDGDDAYLQYSKEHKRR